MGAFKDIETSKDAFEALQEDEYIRYKNLPLKAKDGRLIQVEFVSNVYQAGSEKVIQCNIRDITEHKRIIAALQENEKKYFNLLNQSSDGVFIIDLAGNILTVNKAMCRELEFSLDQYRERLTKILAGESFEQAGEYEVCGKNGKNHYVEVLSTPHYSGKDIVGFQGIARDITRRKRLCDNLKQETAGWLSTFPQLFIRTWSAMQAPRFMSARKSKPCWDIHQRNGWLIQNYGRNHCTLKTINKYWPRSLPQIRTKNHLKWNIE